MLRSLAVIGLFSAFLTPAVAAAQGMGQGPPMPMAVDLGKVPVGTWASYNMTMGQMPPMTTKMALVGKGIIETSVEGGMAAAAGGKMTLQMTLAPAAQRGRFRRIVMQMGTADPMELPMSGDQQHFSKPNPKMLVKEESVTVKGGTFKAKHYRDKTPNGDTIDYWISEKVFPLGLVKMESEQKTNPTSKARSRSSSRRSARGPSRPSPSRRSRWIRR